MTKIDLGKLVNKPIMSFSQLGTTLNRFMIEFEDRMVTCI